AKFSGRLSSVLDVQMREGNNKNFSVRGGLGLISSRLTIEAPIRKEKSSFLVSVRRTYADVFTRLINQTRSNDPKRSPIPDYYFYDGTAKLNFILSQKDRLFVSSYFGRDVFLFKQNRFNFNFNWGNLTTSARWNHLFTDKLFLNTTAIFSDYNYFITNRFEDFELTAESRIRDFTLKLDLDWFANPKHTIKYGGMWIYHIFTPGGLNAGNDSIRFSFNRKLYG
ncbi:MAG: TonB-dependent receptor, partial [Bacteroidia bacterium]|nr:TonB-dependent receptor [Bacteroidia bacterium]